MVVIGLGTVSSASAAQVQSLIIHASQQQGIPPAIALAVASHESRFDPNAQNPGSSAAGVMQLMKVTQQDMGVTNPYDATQNVDAGVTLLAKYYAQYGNWDQALQAYSDGPGTVAKGLPPSTQTRGLIDYVNTFDAGPILVAAGVTPTAPGDFTSVNGDSGALDYSDGSGGLLAASTGGIGVAEAVGIGLAALIGYMALER